MLRLLLAAAFVLFAFTVEAEIKGTWKGSGIYEASWEGPYTTDVEVTLTQSATSIFIMDCWNYTDGIRYSYCFAETYPIVGNDLLWNGNKVGSLTSNGFTISYDINGLVVNITLDEQGQLKYSHTENGGGQSLSLTAEQLVK